MNRGAKRLWLTIVTVLGIAWNQNASPASPPGRDRVVQAPELSPPGRGSLAGALAGRQWSPGDLSRGTLSLPFPASIPEGRGPILVDILPSYAPEHGLTEWGQGWSNTLALTRFRPVGDVQFDDIDELTSPWGRLSQGADGAWYPAGLQQFVRVTADASGWLAVTSDGSRFTFSKDVAVVGPRGVFAWYLTRADDIVGHHTELAYDQGQGGRPYLTSALYGGRHGYYQQRLIITYEPVPQPIVRFDAGAPVTLNRRVKCVSIESRNTKTGAWQPRFRYNSHYMSDGVGPRVFFAAGYKNLCHWRKRTPCGVCACPLERAPQPSVVGPKSEVAGLF